VEEQINHHVTQFRIALESSDAEKEKFKTQMTELKKQMEIEMFKCTQEIQFRDELINRKQQEIEFLKKESLKNNQQHEKQLHLLRTKVV